MPETAASPVSAAATRRLEAFYSQPGSIAGSLPVRTPRCDCRPYGHGRKSEADQTRPAVDAIAQKVGHYLDTLDPGEKEAIS